MVHLSCGLHFPDEHFSVQIVELKGNIRVLARVRPMIEKEWASSGGGGDPQAVKVIDEETVAVSGATVKEYNFDKVFAPADRQEQVRTTLAAVSGIASCIKPHRSTMACRRLQPPAGGAVQCRSGS